MDLVHTFALFQIMSEILCRKESTVLEEANDYDVHRLKACVVELLCALVNMSSEIRSDLSKGDEHTLFSVSGQKMLYHNE
jgi:hypothetical protein